MQIYLLLGRKSTEKRNFEWASLKTFHEGLQRKTKNWNLFLLRYYKRKNFVEMKSIESYGTFIHERYEAYS